MFENVVVNGSSSCIPGQYTDDADNEGFEPDADGHDESPMTGLPAVTITIYHCYK